MNAAWTLTAPQTKAPPEEAPLCLPLATLYLPGGLTCTDIPWEADGGEDFFSTTEVNTALAILNPDWDAIERSAAGKAADKAPRVRHQRRRTRQRAADEW